MRDFSYGRILGWVLLCVLGAGTGCTRSAGTGDVLRVQIGAEPVALDPALAEDGTSLKILSVVMDGLVGYDGAGALKNRLAASYEVSSDGRRYEFTLRAGATWSDGRPVRAQDFVDAFRRALAPGTPSMLAPLLHPIRGARELSIGKSAPSSLGVSVGPNGNLVIELERRAPYFIHALTLPVAMPVRLDKLDPDGKWPREWKNIPVTGTFRIVEREPERSLTLERNGKHWAAAGVIGSRGAIASIRFEVVQDETTAVTLFEQGRFDVLTRVPSFDLERLRKRGLVRTDPFFATYYLAFNHRKPPFNDRSWRRAVSAAIRRDEIALALGGGESPARSWVPKGLEGYVPWEPVASASPGGPALTARSMMQGRTVEAYFDSSSRNSTIMEKVQRDVGAALGLRLELRNLDWKTYVRQMHVEAPPFYRFGWLAPFADPIAHLQAFTTGSPNNHGGFTNVEYDRLVREIEELERGPSREEKLRRAQRLLVDEEAALIPLYHYVQTHGVAERVRGFRVNPFGVIRFEELTIGLPGTQNQ